MAKMDTDDQQRTVVIAIDQSEYSENAWECKYVILQTHMHTHAHLCKKKVDFLISLQ